jgi:predicted nucleotidyltransferase
MFKALDEMIARIKMEEGELRRRGICHLSIFGSMARGGEHSSSDVDIAIDVEPGRHFSLIRMEEARLMLEDILGRPVDLGEIDSFRPAVRAAYNREHVRVF